MSRPRAETMPAVTVPPRLNGLPIASTQSPTGFIIGKLDRGKIGTVIDFDQCQIGARIGSDHPCRIGFAIVGEDLDLFRVLDNMIVGHRETIGRDKEARSKLVTSAPGGALFGLRRRKPSIGVSREDNERSSSATRGLASSLTRTEMTAGFTLSTMSANPIGPCAV